MSSKIEPAMRMCLEMTSKWRETRREVFEKTRRKGDQTAAVGVSSLSQMTEVRGEEWKRTSERETCIWASIESSPHVWLSNGRIQTVDGGEQYVDCVDMLINRLLKKIGKIWYEYQARRTVLLMNDDFHRSWRRIDGSTSCRSDEPALTRLAKTSPFLGLKSDHSNRSNELLGYRMHIDKFKGVENEDYDLICKYTWLLCFESFVITPGFFQNNQL